MISFVVGMDEKNVIGANNDLPWEYLPRDMKFFKDTTMNGTIFMGRKTYESIGRPLPNRKSVVLTSGEDTFPEEVEVVRDLSYVQEFNEKHPNEELYVIGGQTIFEQSLEDADRLYVTHIHATVEGDTFFPEIDSEKWALTSESFVEKDDENVYDMTFAVYDRKYF